MWFESSIGVIQSLTIERGGDDRLWSVDNMPLEINCTVTIQDMYSTTALTKSSRLVAFNAGLTSYLDNMAGIRTDRLIDMRRVTGWWSSKVSRLHYNLTRFPLLLADGFYSMIGNFLN